MNLSEKEEGREKEIMEEFEEEGRKQIEGIMKKIEKEEMEKEVEMIEREKKINIIGIRREFKVERYIEYEMEKMEVKEMMKSEVGKMEKIKEIRKGDVIMEIKLQN